MSDQWKPIETAPHDGTPILAWGGDKIGVLQVMWDSSHKAWLSSWDRDEILSPEKLTHWMPEPAGPKEH